MDIEGLHSLLFPLLPQEQKETAERNKADEISRRKAECSGQYFAMAQQYHNFFAATKSGLDWHTTPEITIAHIEHPRLGDGKLVAHVRGYDYARKDTGNASAHNFETLFKFKPMELRDGRIQRELILGLERFESNISGETTGLTFSGYWGESTVDRAEKHLADLLPQVQSTLDMLTEAATNPELNPGLAPSVQAYYERLQPVG